VTVQFIDYVCPACHHADHDPGSCEWCPRCELHYDEAADWLRRGGYNVRPIGPTPASPLCMHLPNPDAIAWACTQLVGHSGPHDMVPVPIRFIVGSQ
jgi:hypothetical protein